MMIVLRVIPVLEAARALADIKRIAWDFPGDQPLTIKVADRTLRLGDLWLYDGSPACLAALSEFGTVEGPSINQRPSGDPDGEAGHEGPDRS